MNIVIFLSCHFQSSLRAFTAHFVRTNKPQPLLHVKNRRSPTDPSFFPQASSSSLPKYTLFWDPATPVNIPRYLTTPQFSLPKRGRLTRSPTFKSMTLCYFDRVRTVVIADSQLDAEVAMCSLTDMQLVVFK